jgi:hypothetical protein
MMVDPNPLGRKLKDKTLPMPPKKKVFASTLNDHMSAIGDPQGNKESYNAPANGTPVNDAVRRDNMAGAWGKVKSDMRNSVFGVGAQVKNPNGLLAKPGK